MGSLCFVGLGLYDEKDISVKGLERVRSADRVFLESYTAVLMGTTHEKLEAFYGRAVESLGRAEVEDGSVILDAARGEREEQAGEESVGEGCPGGKDVVLLVVGDALTATTHDSLRMDAQCSGIEVEVIHGASITSAVSLLGLQNYRFGRTTTLVFPEKNYFPTSPYEIIRSNLEAGLHTLVLLDIRADEERFMSIHDALDVLWLMEEKMSAEGKGGLVSENLPICAVCRAGSPAPFLWSGTAGEARNVDFGPPLHTIVIPAKLNFAEKEFLEAFASRN